MYINWKHKELIITIALYGPAGSGKTTTWHVLSKGAVAQPKSGDDTFSLHLDNIQGKKVFLNVRDIPGRTDAILRRKVALYGVDGLIFVADSDPSRQKVNAESLEELEGLLQSMGKSIYTMPFLFQYNRRDLPNALEIEDLQNNLNPDRVFPHQETSAAEEEGIVEVLRQATDLVLTTVL